MRNALIYSSHRSYRVSLMERGSLDGLSLHLHGLAARLFASQGEAMSYLVYWRSDVGATADLRFAQQRIGILSAGSRGQGQDSLLPPPANQFMRGSLWHYRHHLPRTARRRLTRPPSSSLSALARLQAELSTRPQQSRPTCKRLPSRREAVPRRCLTT